MNKKLTKEEIKENIAYHKGRGDFKQYKKWERIARLNGIELSEDVKYENTTKKAIR